MSMDVRIWTVCMCIYESVLVCVCMYISINSQRNTARGRGWGGRGYGKEGSEAE